MRSVYPGCKPGLCPDSSKGGSDLCSAVYRVEEDLGEYAKWAASAVGPMPVSVVAGEKINGQVLLNSIVRLPEMLGDEQDGVTCRQRICQSVPVQVAPGMDPGHESPLGGAADVGEPALVAERVPPPPGAVGGRRRRHRTRRRVRRKRRKTRAERRSRSRRRKTRRKK